MTEMALAGVPHRAIVPLAGARPAPAYALSAEVLHGATAYNALQADWQRLVTLQNAAVVFQLPDLLACWAYHFADDRSLATIVVRHENRPVLIWPLLIERRALVRIATVAGAPIGQYNEILLDPDYDGKDAFAAALAELKRTIKPDLILLERVRANGPLRNALGTTPALCWPEGAPYSDLSRGKAHLLMGLKSGVVRKQRKRMKRFRSLGLVGFEMATDPKQARRWLAEALALKREWLRLTGRLSRAFARRATANCLADLALTLTGAGAAPEVLVSRLTVDAKTAAMEVGFRHGEAYYLYLRAYSQAFAKFGPGNVLTDHVLDWCVDNGISCYDMMAPRSRNKAEWRSGEVATLDFALPMTLIGRLYAATVLRRFGPTLRKLFYALPMPLRSSIAGFSVGR